MKLYLKKDPFDSILSQDKTIEVRKLSKYLIKNFNDTKITFENNNRFLNVNIISTKMYSNFNDMINDVDLKKIRKNINRNDYIKILKNCYKKITGKWIVINFKF